MPQNFDRRQQTRKIRESAAELAFNRDHPEHLANGDEQKYANAQYLMSFTKGLDHDPKTGLICDKQDFEAFRQAIDNGFIEPFTTRVPVPTCMIDDPCGETDPDTGKVIQVPRPRRRWEAPTAGTAFDLQGPDAQAVTMPPAPPLCSDELTFEMAEVYELALVRDVPFNLFDCDPPKKTAENKQHMEDLKASINRLNDLDYAKNDFPGRPRISNGPGGLDEQNVFRGSSPGVDQGPYLSQFMLIGNPDRGDATVDHTAGKIEYGAQVIDQRVPEAEEKDDYMVNRDDWLEVQQGYAVDTGGPNGQRFSGRRRFIATPRDLATYVHFDALYQAYLNACLILLGNKTPFDPAFDLLSGVDGYKFLVDAFEQNKMNTNAGGFALYGGPHILSLVTEVATRALKAVRFQKFNNHIRARPEVLAARLEYLHDIKKEFWADTAFVKCLESMDSALGNITKEIKRHNASIEDRGDDTKLLPMAFAEGSPMHPAYGAGHATVAGACVTMLKAFFDTSALFAEIVEYDNPNAKNRNVKSRSAGFFSADQLNEAKRCKMDVNFVSFEPVSDGSRLSRKSVDCPLTLEGELNKLAANISIGRNMAGVHYFSDYYDSVRMGEEIAIGILEEQALTYPTDPFVLSVPTFDGEVVRIGRR
ncbi:MAG: vanadium-dependent haloperoxidase [Pseudomonadota bacterium]